jgi:hypothetical protein
MAVKAEALLLQVSGQFARLPGSCLVDQCLPKTFVIRLGKRGYRVRLNGEDHQWGKDPPKEVVG